jgi:tetratricopeptide (TPR) repeat protein
MLLLALSCLPLRAQKAWSEGDMDAATALAHRQLSRDPQDLEALLMLGRAQARQGDCALAMPNLQRADELAAAGSWQSGWARLVLGACHQHLGELEEAIALWRSIPDSEDHHADDAARRQLVPYVLDAELLGWEQSESPHLRVFWSPATELDREAWLAGREAAYQALVDFAEAEPRLPIEIVVWQDDEDAVPWLGRGLGYAEVARGRIHTRHDQTRGHELAHVVLGQGHPAEHSTKLISEGAAVMLDQTDRDRVPLARRALDGESVDLVELWQRWDEELDAGYPIAGAWAERLHARGGHERFLQLLVDQRYEHAQELYGPELQVWIDELEAELSPTPP